MTGHSFVGEEEGGGGREEELEGEGGGGREEELEGEGGGGREEELEGEGGGGREEELEGEGERERKSALFDVEGDSEDGSHTLFEPSSPLQLMPTGILPDIAEETEGDTECERSWGGRGQLDLTTPPLAGLEPEMVEYAETGFFDAMETTSPAHCDPPQETTGKTPLVVAPPPSLPVSPPPGPVLSPRLSTLIAETTGTNHSGTPSPHPTTDQPNRHSLASLSGDSPPPPLPSSLPPGKLISPRHSLMDSDPRGPRPNSILGGMGTRLDAALLSEKVSTVISEGKIKSDSHDSVPETLVRNDDTPNPSGHYETESTHDNEEPLLITTIDEVDDPEEEDQLDDPNEPLPPPLEDTPTNLGEPKLKMTPSFLRSLEPPREFSSDSGFPDTDHTPTPEPGEAGHAHFLIGQCGSEFFHTFLAVEATVKGCGYR